MVFFTSLVKNGEIRHSLSYKTEQNRTTRGNKSTQFLKETTRDLF